MDLDTHCLLRPMPAYRREKRTKKATVCTTGLSTVGQGQPPQAGVDRAGSVEEGLPRLQERRRALAGGMERGEHFSVCRVKRG